MPRTLKRRADAINDDDQESANDSPQPPRRRQRSSSSSSAPDSEASPERATQAGSSASTYQPLVKKLLRLALSSEYSRIPLRRADISTKVLGDTHSRQFKPIFAGAQSILRSTFGMQLVELPSREKTTLKDRRTQATQNAARREKESQAKNVAAASSSSSSSSSKSWILTSILPAAFKSHPVIISPARAPTTAAESTYTALYTFILSLIYLNNGALAENKLERYLHRVDADTYMPLESHPTAEKLLQRMVKDGYVEKRRDTSSGEEVVEWVVGPRGKVEVGVKGVVGLVRGVYGLGVVAGGRQSRGARGQGQGEEEEEEEEDAGGVVLVKADEDELNQKLIRSLGVAVEDLDVDTTPDGPRRGEQ